MGYYSSRANLPRIEAQQNVRIRHFKLKFGFISVTNEYNCRVLSKPLGLKNNIYFCKSREDLSLNILSGQGMNCKTLRVTTPESFRTLCFHLSNEKALTGRPKYYKMLLPHWNRKSEYSTMSYKMFTCAIFHTRYLFSKLGRYATELIVAIQDRSRPIFCRSQIWHN